MLKIQGETISRYQEMPFWQKPKGQDHNHVQIGKNHGIQKLNMTRWQSALVKATSTYSLDIRMRITLKNFSYRKSNSRVTFS
jgi:hypothetical protein